MATVLQLDMVGSTSIASRLGDARWRELLRQFRTTVRRELKRRHGHEEDSPGDGFFATFEQPADGVRCAAAITAEVQLLGIDVRSGLHTGECEVVDGKLAGIAVHIASRAMALAGPSEVVVTNTVKDLVRGAGIGFNDFSTEELRGVPGTWQLFAVAEVDGNELPAPLDEGAQPGSKEWTPPPPQRRPARRGSLLAGGLAAVALVSLIMFLLFGGHSRQGAQPPSNTTQAPPIVPNSLVGLDPETLEVTDVIPIPGGIGSRIAGERQSGPIALFQEYVLAAAGPLTTPPAGTCCGNAREVALIGTTSHSVHLFQDTGQVNGLAFGHGALWIANCGTGKLTAFQGNTVTSGLTTIGTVPLRNPEHCAEVIGFDAGDFWVAELSPGEAGYTHDIVDRIDPQTMAIKAQIEVLSQTSDMAFGADSVWVVESGNDTHSYVYRISEATNRVSNRFQFPPVVPWPAISVAYGSGFAWVVDWNVVYRIDPTDDSVQEFRITSLLHHLGSLAAEAGAVWTDDSATGTVFKVDPRSGKVARVKDLGFKTYGLLPYGGKIWVGVGDSLG